jgi:myo-inositol-1(or 4)-monophosphatase
MKLVFMRNDLAEGGGNLWDNQKNGTPVLGEQADFDLMTQAVREAGGLALEFFGNRKNSTWLKDDGTAVSDADIAVDRLLHQRLLEQREDYGWLSEETTDDLVRLDKSHVWIVDPIDGTRAFLHGKPHWVVSVALVVGGVVQMGCLYNPVEDEFFEAALGRGARLNAGKLQIDGRREIEGATIIAAPGRFKTRNWPTPWPRVKSFMVNSIAYRMALVASNRADALLSLSGKSDWDLAAADLLVREAGGLVSDHKGEAFCFNRQKTRHPSVLVANPDLYEKMLDRTRRVAASKRHGCGHN